MESMSLRRGVSLGGPLVGFHVCLVSKRFALLSQGYIFPSNFSCRSVYNVHRCVPLNICMCSGWVVYLEFMVTTKRRHVRTNLQRTLLTHKLFSNTCLFSASVSQPQTYANSSGEQGPTPLSQPLPVQTFSTVCQCHKDIIGVPAKQCLHFMSAETSYELYIRNFCFVCMLIKLCVFVSFPPKCEIKNLCVFLSLLFKC